MIRVRLKRLGVDIGDIVFLEDGKSSPWNKKNVAKIEEETQQHIDALLSQNQNKYSITKIYAVLLIFIFGLQYFVLFKTIINI